MDSLLKQNLCMDKPCCNLVLCNLFIFLTFGFAFDFLKEIGGFLSASLNLLLSILKTMQFHF